MPLYNPPQTPLSVTTKGDIQTFSTTPARLPVGTDGQILTANSSATNGIEWTYQNGWISAYETWTYVSVDDPTGIFKVNANVTTKYSAGMRIKMTNATNVIYGIITVVGAYTGGYTSITFLHQIDPTDSLALVLMANSAITANYYSVQKAPFGFPLSPLSWTIIKTDSTLRTQTSPTSGTWYNLGSVNISIPIGSWEVAYKVANWIEASSTPLPIYNTLSTANNSQSDADFTVRSSNANLNSMSVTHMMRKNLSVSSKTSYYINTKTDISGITKIENTNSQTGLIITAICSYL